MELIVWPKMGILALFTLICTGILLGDSQFRKNLKEVKKRRIHRGANLKIILIRFSLFAPLLIVITLIVEPEELFIFPRSEFFTWIVTLLLYSLFSAYPQELIYRTFLFHRYKSLFSSAGMIVLASSVTFGYMHLIYENFIAVFLTLLGGYIFSHTYLKTNSLLITGLEHSLYGGFIFTVGLGSYFM
ncbi:hypothetical protein CHISP_1062 [Chitinispirillum alkaliphilum]|nr:hypothetical protein CHISP_1062 [Chitinispirillum alkaliphilum]